MKHTKILLSLFFTVIITQAFAQTDKETTAKIVANKTYVFVANSATPLANNEVNQVLRSFPGAQGGGTINLSGSQYDLLVKPDSLIAFLPYYGRSFSAPYNPTEGGIKFTSKNFSYKETKNKKGGYTISIRTNDLKMENYQMTLNISQNGYATLIAYSNNKQPINFNGYLDEVKKKK
ncbi:DUF4251 domain-containing protein [Pedobacter jamesrossensis]|uniref:DUF4251 domain-containing protein n=1 Tax=Pedobacter jamesrossensis TaxID=1908238 RepID=A0ABV8NG18_9SPHI